MGFFQGLTLVLREYQLSPAEITGYGLRAPEATTTCGSDEALFLNFCSKVRFEATEAGGFREAGVGTAFLCTQTNQGEKSLL